MKNLFSFFLLIISYVGIAQQYEWMTSFDVAKKMALSQNKLLFVMWEDAAIDFETPMVVDKRKIEWVSILDNTEINKTLWDHFVPVVLSELHYEEWYLKIKDKRPGRYIERFNDDSVKIMDASGNILNTRFYFEGSWEAYLNTLINLYGINTSYLSMSLRIYSEHQNFVTSYRLASRYFEFAIFNNQRIKKEFIELGQFYLNEALAYNQSNPKNREALQQRCELTLMESDLVLNNPRKVFRQLKKLDSDTIADSNKTLFSFLNYTTLKMIGKDSEAALWKSELSSLDLEKTELIINSNKH